MKKLIQIAVQDKVIRALEGALDITYIANMELHNYAFKEVEVEGRMAESKQQMNVLTRGALSDKVCNEVGWEAECQRTDMMLTFSCEYVAIFATYNRHARILRKLRTRIWSIANRGVRS